MASPALRGLAVTGGTFVVLGGSTIAVSRVLLSATRFALKQHRVS